MNPYNILGISSSASSTEIKRSYRELAKIHHPDKGGDPEKFKQIKYAYEILSDETSKEYYDMTGKIPNTDSDDNINIDISNIFSGIFGGGLFGAMGGGGGGRGSGGRGEDGGIRGTPFPNFFGGNQMKQEQQEKPPPRVEKISLTLAQLYSGYNFKLHAQRSKTCIDCSGTGSAESETCSLCSGKGSCIKIMNMGGLIMQSHSICMECRGDGKKTVRLCTVCSGSGKINEERFIDVVILPGTQHGEKILFQEVCSEIEGFKKPGDLIIEIVQISQDNWIRNVNDLHISCSISIKTALIGGEIILKNHPSMKDIPVQIPPATFTNDIITLHGLGMPDKTNTGVVGDLFVKINNIEPVSNIERTMIKNNNDKIKLLFHDIE